MERCKKQPEELVYRDSRFEYHRNSGDCFSLQICKEENGFERLAFLEIKT
jgi:hypothetical protein